ncbi:MAG TPA: alpha/beta fold hydrolase [Myxococcales bacterium]|nr:alpha/beta fold hydrolase [Myxococcales bacterium]HZX93236.1 alpha/beta fold hydrolase [Myxococcales bacterium]
MRSTIAALLFTVSFQARADKPGDPPHQRLEIGDLPLEGGGVIKDFSLSYVTHGKLDAQKANAVLMMASLGGNHHRIDFMIGPGKALDTNKYFVICTDAIANGRTTSPSNSKAQHGLSFPRFVIRDNLTAYRKLLAHLGIKHLVAVAGASMGGMQSLQYAVSYPGEVDAVIALTPMARTPAWSVAVTEATRKALLADPAYDKGNYTKQPEAGWRAEIDILFGLATRAPDGMKAKFPSALDVIPWMKGLEDAQLKAGFDANDWMYQTWAYDRFDISTTPGKPFNGDLAAALKSIRAHTIVLHDRLDLLNPVEEAKEAAEGIPGAKFYLLPFDPPAGHFTASAGSPAGVEFTNKVVSEFLAENRL